MDRLDIVDDPLTHEQEDEHGYSIDKFLSDVPLPDLHPNALYNDIL